MTTLIQNPAAALPAATATATPTATAGASPARRALQGAAAGWLVVALLGQALFAAYVLGLYGPPALQGNFAGWNRVMPHGYVPGQTLGNAVLASHLLFTVVVLLGGALQLLPALRSQAPRVHHAVGRLYITAAVVLAVGGLYMVWSKAEPAKLGQHLGMTLNAVLILAFAGLALRAAMARQLQAHRRWALRLYLAVLGVWFFRIGLMLWLVVNRAPVGFDPKTFTGPFLTFLGFAQTLVPLALLQLYFHAQRSTRPQVQALAAGGLVLLTLATAAGSAAAYLIMWRAFL